MHELGLCEAIVAAGVAEAGGRRVRSMRVRVAGHPVDHGVVDQGVQLAAAGTVLEGARVELAVEPLLVTCRGCGATAAAGDAIALAVCRACGGFDVGVAEADAEGGEVFVESIAFAPEELPWTR